MWSQIDVFFFHITLIIQHLENYLLFKILPETVEYKIAFNHVCMRDCINLLCLKFIFRLHCNLIYVDTKILLHLTKLMSLLMKKPDFTLVCLI